jgi:hypothetical protein
MLISTFLNGIQEVSYLFNQPLIINGSNTSEKQAKIGEIGKSFSRIFYVFKRFLRFLQHPEPGALPGCATHRINNFY